MESRRFSSSDSWQEIDCVLQGFVEETMSEVKG